MNYPAAEMRGIMTKNVNRVIMSFWLVQNLS